MSVCLPASPPACPPTADITYPSPGAVLQYDSAMQGQAQAAAAQGMALRFVGSLDFVERKCTVELKVYCLCHYPAFAATLAY